MTQLFQYVVDRLRALFMTEVGLDLEAQFLKREAERKADLLREAAKYAEEGFDDIAETLREQAGQISIDRPLASVLPAVQHLGTSGNPSLSAEGEACPQNPTPSTPATTANQNSANETRRPARNKPSATGQTKSTRRKAASKKA